MANPDFPAAQALCAFIDAAPTARHAAASMVDALRAHDFTLLDLQRSEWGLAPGRYMVQRGASVVAFVLRRRSFSRIHVIGAHTDSPHLHLKPAAAYAQDGYAQFGVEVYGGALYNSWLDRDLGVAGCVHLRDGSQTLVRVHQPLARVAQLAIHLDRKVNDDGLKLNPQLHLAPIWGLVGSDTDPTALIKRLAMTLGLSADDILTHDLSLYDLTPSTLGGANQELLFAPRLDNLASCHAGLCALLASTDGDDGTLPVLACFDHEEVGSMSDTGANGVLLENILERISLECGMTRSALLSSLARGLMLSADMAHALHPNYPDRHEPRHRPMLGQGPVLKSNVNVRYATTAESAAAVHRLAASADIPLQNFVARGDIGCGSTIGPAVASRLGMAVADLGSPMLSMHSARECAASADHAQYIALLTAHLCGN
jgi:aspartyl aminopeptidase